MFFPLSLPGLFAGALIVFIICLGFYVTPAVLGGGKVIMVSNQIASDIELFFNWGAASALGVVLLVLTLALPRDRVEAALGKVSARERPRRKFTAAARGATVRSARTSVLQMSCRPTPHRATRITHGRRLWLYVLAGLVLAFLACRR